MINLLDRIYNLKTPKRFIQKWADWAWNSQRSSTMLKETIYEDYWGYKRT